MASAATAGFSANAHPRGITLGPDGNLWFTEFASPGRIGRITPAGVVTEFPIAAARVLRRPPAGRDHGRAGRQPVVHRERRGRIGAHHARRRRDRVRRARAPARPITSGPDGALWFTEPGSPGGIGRITTAGVVTGSSREHPRLHGRPRADRDHGRRGRQPLVHRGRRSGRDRAHRPRDSPIPTPTATATAATADSGADRDSRPGTPARRRRWPPRVTALTSSVPMVAGSPALLSAEVLGSPQHLDWDLNGDGKTEVSCPGDQPTLTLPPACARRSGARRGRRRQRVRPGGRRRRRRRRRCRRPSRSRPPPRDSQADQGRGHQDRRRPAAGRTCAASRATSPRRRPS